MTPDFSRPTLYLTEVVRLMIEGYFKDSYEFQDIGPCSERGTPFQYFAWGVKVEEGEPTLRHARQVQAVVAEVMKWLVTQDPLQTVVWRLLPEIDNERGIWRIRWRLALE